MFASQFVMPPLSRRQFLALASALPATELCAQRIGGGGWAIHGTDPIELLFQERRVSSYHAGLREGLPFLDPLVGPGGASLTAPPLPPQEGKRLPGQGLWFSLTDLNGYDFRPGTHLQPGEESAGRILHKGLNGVQIQSQEITLRTKSEWLDARDEMRRVCSDRRVIRFSHRHEGILVVDCQIELMADAGDLFIAAETEGFWSLRLTAGLIAPSAEVKWSNSVGQRDEAVFGAAAEWVRGEGKDAKGKPAGIALFCHPTNPGHPSLWRSGPEGAVSASPFPDNLIVRNGDTLLFRYRAALHAGELSEEAHRKLQESFAYLQF